MQNKGVIIGIALVAFLCILLLGGTTLGVGVLGIRGMMPGLPFRSYGIRFMSPLGFMAFPLLWLFLLGGVVLIVASLTRGPQKPAPTSAAIESPLEILKLRYAKGEITKEQFDDMKKTLEA